MRIEQYLSPAEVQEIYEHKKEMEIKYNKQSFGWHLKLRVVQALVCLQYVSAIHHNARLNRHILVSGHLWPLPLSNLTNGHFTSQQVHVDSDPEKILAHQSEYMLAQSSKTETHDYIQNTRPLEMTADIAIDGKSQKYHEYLENSDRYALLLPLHTEKASALSGVHVTLRVVLWLPISELHFYVSPRSMALAMAMKVCKKGYFVAATGQEQFTLNSSLLVKQDIHLQPLHEDFLSLQCNDWKTNLHIQEHEYLQDSNVKYAIGLFLTLILIFTMLCFNKVASSANVNITHEISPNNCTDAELVNWHRDGGRLTRSENKI